MADGGADVGGGEKVPEGPTPRNEVPGVRPELRRPDL